DLPPEEAADLRAALAAHGVALILLASPTTSDARLQALCDDAQGYLYYVSFAGVTGASDRLDTALASDRLRTIRTMSHVPVVAGFGIRDAASAVAMAHDAEGVVVGSALVAALAEASDADDAARRASAFVAPLRTALDAAARMES
ncbi:MAG: tryptophan synthase subunit alpha, partial [Burkholderiales bacterium]